MTQEIYLWCCSGKREEDLARIMRQVAGVIDARRNGDWWISRVWLNEQYGDRFESASWIHKGTRSYNEAKRMLVRSDDYRHMVAWIRRQDGPVLLMDPLSRRLAEDTGVGSRLCELLTEDGFICHEWDRRDKQSENGQIRVPPRFVRKYTVGTTK